MLACSLVSHFGSQKMPLHHLEIFSEVHISKKEPIFEIINTQISIYFLFCVFYYKLPFLG
jgi:hypothetical protein